VVNTIVKLSFYYMNEKLTPTLGAQNDVSINVNRKHKASLTDLSD